MARADLQVVGAQGTVPRRITTSGTAIQAGEPVYQDGVTFSSGAASGNYFELMDADGIVVGTDWFGGVAIENSLNVAAGTTEAQYIRTANPVPAIGQIRGNAETAASVDTQTELNGLYGDFLLIDYNATGGSDGGELYTIKVAPAANTSAFQLVWGDPALSILGVVTDGQAYRNTVS
jgi:hypothetical protein